MNVYIPLVIILVLLCFINRKNAKNRESFFLFAIISTFIFAGLRYEFGPDYFSYHDIFRYVKSSSVQAYIDFNDHIEPLFVSYLGLFSNFTLFIAFNSLLWFGANFLILKNNVEGNYYWIVLIIFFFDVNCVLNNLVAMKTEMCAILSIAAFSYLGKNKKIHFLFFIALSSFFHLSTIMLLPFVFISGKKKSFLFSKLFIVVVLIFTLITVFVGRNTFLVTMSQFMMDKVEEFSKYSSYIDSVNADDVGFVVIIKLFLLKILTIIPFFAFVKASEYENKPKNLFFLKIGIVTSAITLIFGQGLMARYLMLLNPFFIIALFKSVKYFSPVTRSLILGSVIFSSVYIYISYIQADYCVSFLQYKTIFRAPSIP